jgi:hypothetical protein
MMIRGCPASTSEPSSKGSSVTRPVISAARTTLSVAVTVPMPRICRTRREVSAAASVTRAGGRCGAACSVCEVQNHHPAAPAAVNAATRRPAINPRRRVRTQIVLLNSPRTNGGHLGKVSRGRCRALLLE